MRRAQQVIRFVRGLPRQWDFIRPRMEVPLHNLRAHWRRSDPEFSFAAIFDEVDPVPTEPVRLKRDGAAMLRYEGPFRIRPIGRGVMLFDDDLPPESLEGWIESEAFEGDLYVSGWEGHATIEIELTEAPE